MMRLKYYPLWKLCISIGLLLQPLSDDYITVSVQAQAHVPLRPFLRSDYLTTFLSQPHFDIYSIQAGRIYFFSTHFGSLSYRPNRFLFLRILVVQPTVSKLLRQVKPLSFSTHFSTLAYMPNIFIFLLILVVYPTVKKLLRKKKGFSVQGMFFLLNLFIFLRILVVWLTVKFSLPKKRFQHLGYIFSSSCVCNYSKERNGALGP